MNFLRSNGGGVAIMTALFITVGFLAVATAYEITAAVSVKNKLSRTADAAMLAGTGAAARAYEAGHDDWADEGKRVAETFWQTAVAQETSADITSFAFDFTLSDKTISGSGEYFGKHASLFSAFVPGPVSIGNSTSTQMNLRTYIDLTFLVDVSPSMGIGATAADQTLMTDNNCLLYTSPSPRDRTRSRMPSSA